MKPNSSDIEPLLTPKPPRLTKGLALVGAALLLVGVGMGWQGWRQGRWGQIAIGQPQQPQGVPVTLATLELDTITVSSDYVGTLEADQVVEIRPEITGRVRRWFVAAGDRVNTGDPIAELQPDQAKANDQSVQANVAAAQANHSSTLANVNAARANHASVSQGIAAARANYFNAYAQLQALEDERLARYAEAELAYTDYARIAFLVAEGAFATQQLDQAERDRDVALANMQSLQERIFAAQANVEQARAEFEAARANAAQSRAGIDAAQASAAQAKAGLNQAQAERDRARAQLNDTLIRAPFPGVIGDIPIRVGSVVSDSDTITTVTQNGRLNLRISVPVERSDQLKIGQFVELVTEEGNVLDTGEVSFIDSNIDTAKQTILAKATFRNAGSRLRNGQFVRARVIWRTEPGMLVPTTAITRLAGEPFVFVAVPPGPDAEVSPDTQFVAEQRPVKLGKLQGNRYHVTSGLQPGEQLVVTGVMNLTHEAALLVQQPGDRESDILAP